MKLRAIFVLIVVLLASCTIQKRVHNRGWHVQWNSKRNVSHHDSKPNPSTIALEDVAEIQDEASPERVSTESSIPQKAIEQTEQLTPDPIQSDQVSIVETLIDEPSIEPSTEKVVDDVKSVEASKSSRFSGFRGIAPGRLFIYAGVYALLALICFIAAINVSGSIATTLLFFGTAIFGVLALIFLLLAIIALIIQLYS